MQSSRRITLVAFFVALTLPVEVRAQASFAKIAIEFTEARSVGSRHTFRFITRPALESVRILIVYEKQGWQPGTSRGLKGRETSLALAQRVIPRSSIGSTSPNTNSDEWEISIDEEQLPQEIYAIVCRISDIHGSRQLERELPDVRRILQLVNEPTASNRPKSIEDVLRALFEFDWAPLGYTKMSAKRRGTSQETPSK
jgi:hypothetical protein